MGSSRLLAADGLESPREGDAATSLSDDLELLTAQEAARLLKVDVKTLRRMGPPFILVGKSRRFTRSLLRAWLAQRQEEAMHRMLEAAKIRKGPAPSGARGRSIAPTVPASRVGAPHSASGTIEFAELAGLRPRPRPGSSLTSGGKGGGTGSRLASPPRPK